ncbi:MAG: aminotransferase class V-fold PLP-dependent enzyme [Acidobacteriota bacterium]
MYSFKLADSPHEYAQIHALNYRAFVEEIPQHQPNDQHLHVDRFHEENVYAISLSGEKVVGMLAIRGHRPFSLDGKLPDLDVHLPQGRNPCEVRLLAIDREHRTGPVLPGLLSLLWQHAAVHRFDCAVISATTRQTKLYRHMGFVPFGPLVGTKDAPFQPMLITLEAFREHVRTLPPSIRGERINLLPGPVPVHPDVADALGRRPESHRGDAFLHELGEVRSALCTLTRARHVDVLLGSGTLANDCVAAQLRHHGKGLVLSNGEFGERLHDHAVRMDLPHIHRPSAWGEHFDLDAVRRILQHESPAWLWFVACETSCGMVNDLGALSALCREHDVLLCVDAISAVGAYPLDLSGAHLASGTSGKALGAYPGLSMVFHSEPITASDDLPRYLDLGLYSGDRVPFTQSSNLVSALRTALLRPPRFEEVAALGAWVRERLRKLGFTLIGNEPAPHVITIALEPSVRSDALAASLDRAGFQVAWASDYLLARNWIQIAIMGETTRAQLAALLRELARPAA